MAANLTVAQKMELFKRLTDGDLTQRKLALDLNVHRNTVKKAKQELLEAGYRALTGMSQDVEPVQPLERVQLREAQVALVEARKEVRDLQDMVLDLSSFRDNFLGISKPLKPRPVKVIHKGSGTLTWLIGVFDYHLGKQMHREDVGGLQDYNVEIATNRISRQFAVAARLMREHSQAIDRIVVVLGGDNVNGALRKDDDLSNEIPPMQQARVFAEAAVAGVEHLRMEFSKVEVEIIVLPGNHGRTVKLPPSVDIGDNWDILAGWLIQKHFASDDMVRVVCAEDTPDLVLDVYGKGVFLTHGDRIGSNGGDGQIGSLGPTKRGSLKIAAQHDAIRAYVQDQPELALVLMGHFHSYWTDLSVMVSGAGVGVDPWSLFKLRVKPRPPILPLLGFHRDRGLVLPLTLLPGHPDEGPLLSDPG